MNSNEEVRWFFDSLAQHACVPADGECPTCKLLEKIYALTLQMIFSNARDAETFTAPHIGTLGQQIPSRHVFS